MSRTLPLQTAVGLAVSLGGTALLASPAHRLLGDPERLRTHWLDQTVLWLLFAAILAIVLAWERRPLSSIGLKAAWPRSLALGAALAAFVMWVASPAAVRLAAGLGLPSLDTGVGRFAQWPMALKVFAVVTAGVVEETLFRGYALERLATALGNIWLAGALTLVVFTLVHWPLWGLGGILVIGCNAAIGTLFYIWQRDLAANVVAHVVVDAMGLLVVPALAVASTGSAPTSLPREVARIPLPGVAGRIDHLALDPRTSRLFVAALGNDSVEVVDLAAGRHAAHLPGFREPQGVAFLAERGRLFVSNGEGAGITVLDGTALTRTAWIALRNDPDNIRYEPGADRLWVGEGEGGAGALAALDPGSDALVAEVAVGGHPESFQLETRGARVFVNVPQRHEIAVVDRAKRRVAARWALPCAGNFPMALDEAQRRLFVACRNPAKLLVLDSDTGAPVVEADSPGDADDIFLDPTLHRVYVSGGEGLVRVYERPDADSLRVAGDLPTRAGARTSLFVPAAHRLYVALPRRGGRAAELRVFDTARGGTP